jgi:hypothetical protein
MITLDAMVFNSIAWEVLDRYRDGKMDKDQSLTKLNQLVDYVIQERKDRDNRRDSEDN